MALSIGEWRNESGDSHRRIGKGNHAGGNQAK